MPHTALPVGVFVVTLIGLPLPGDSYLLVGESWVLVDLFGKTLELATPYCATGVRIRLDSHRTAPFLGFLLARLSLLVLGSGGKTVWENPQTSHPILRYRPSYSS